jgi:hypothetical protein
VADKNTVQGLQNINTSSSDYNALSFIIQQAIRQQVNTAIVCKVVGVSGNYVDVLPLVTQIDGFGDAVAPTTLYHIPFMRYHGGICSVKLDPVVGDIGLCVFAQKDCSNVTVGTTEPQKPASFRENTMANGYYLGGFLNKEPSCYIELKQDGSIDITAPSGVSINGNVTVSGGINASADIVGGGISLDNHTHTCPDGETSPPH